MTTIAFFLLFWFIFSFYAIKTIKIEGNIKSSKLLGLENLKGTNLLLISLDKIKEEIAKNNPALEVEEIRKDYPDFLFIKLKQLKPMLQLKLDIGYAHLSENGRVYKKAKEIDKNLPLLNFYQAFDYYLIGVGDVLDYEEITAALFLLRKSEDLNLQVESIDISGLSMIVFNLKESEPVKPDRKLFFTAEKDSVRQADELETLVTRFKIKAQEFQTIDLRYDKPVVKF